MQRRYAAPILLLAGLVPAILHAQSQTEKPQPQKPVEQAARPEPGSPINVKVEVTISETRGKAEPAKKVVTLMTSDRQSGVIRSSGDVRVGDRYRSVAINVDARPVLVRDNTLRLDLALEYQPQSAAGTDNEPGTWRVNERVNVVLQSDKPILVSETFDPSSERRVTVEVKATILK